MKTLILKLQLLTLIAVYFVAIALATFATVALGFALYFWNIGINALGVFVFTPFLVGFIWGIYTLRVEGIASICEELKN